ncbi:related to conserved hypothetical Ustilaginaceae-specific protein [Ustilago trichophora]|uniref:Related to conserved hypothetical Ustilaginaceae-specific protein n=1 Tax=Ustilago trichophora TaxID=86804 RepID=A0A5C3EH80_9BASI|nr:related to conserved hypothetical Ustilaginaceae-specific protein [Ustilago trichophora]
MSLSLHAFDASTTRQQRWDSILLAPQDPQATHATLSAELHSQASAYLHDRLTSRFQPSDLPLPQLRDLLDDILDRSPPNANTNNDVQAPTDGARDALQPPRTPTSNPRARLKTVQAHRNTPRTQRANQCLEAFSRLEAWGVLVRIHCSIMTAKAGPFRQSLFRGATAHLVALLLDGKTELIQVVPELRNPLSDQLSLSSILTEAYSQLASRFQQSDMSALPDRQVAYLLVHLAQSSTRVSGDVGVLSANRHFRTQFGRRYRGDAPLRFLRFVTQLNSQPDPIDASEPLSYFRGTPIVQSSGTGKSRMVIELSSLTPLLYVCFRKRKAEGNAKAGYPLPDEGVRKYFEDAQESHPNFCDLQVACFLSAWFTTLAKTLGDLSKLPDKASYLLQLNRLNQDNPGHIAFFQAVSEQAKQLIDKSEKQYHIQPTTDCNESRPHSLKASIDPNHVFLGVLCQPILALNHELALVSQYLHKAIHHATSAPVPPVLVAFDECVEINVSNSPKGNNQLNSLLRAWNYIRQLEDQCATSQRFWLVLLSTSSSAAALVEHVSVQSSNRRQSSAALPTFVGVGFDVLAEERPSLTCAADACHFDQIITYGRPLWASLDPDDFWTTATLKLQGTPKFDPLQPAQCFSVLASRLALCLVPAHWGDLPFMGEQKAFVDQTVDRHMRIVTRVTDTAGMHVDSPSEPVLAVAASLLMLPRAKDAPELRTIATNRYGLILESFRTRCLLSQHIPIFKGTDGELAARIAMTTAWDAVKEKALRNGASRGLDSTVRTLGEPVLLYDVVQGLAHLDFGHASIVQNRIESIQAVVSALNPTDKVQAWTHFTHFDVIPYPFSEITPEYLWYCWKRGVALQMAHKQHGIDGIIPVFVGDLDAPFVATATGDGSAAPDVAHGARRMTFVAWEAKNRKDAQTSVRTRPDQTGEANFKPKLAGPRLRRPTTLVTAAAAGADGRDGGIAAPLTERALLCILFDLGTAKTFQSTGDQRPQVKIISGTNCPRLWIRGVTDPHAYPCLDHFDVRIIFHRLLDDTHADRLVEDSDNAVSHPLWNNSVRPTLPEAEARHEAVDPSSSTRGETGEDQQSMEFD